MTNNPIGETFMEPGDHAIRRRALKDSFRRKAAHAIRLRALADANGHLTEAGYAAAAEPADDPLPPAA